MSPFEEYEQELVISEDLYECGKSSEKGEKKIHAIEESIVKALKKGDNRGVLRLIKFRDKVRDEEWAEKLKQEKTLIYANFWKADNPWYKQASLDLSKEDFQLDLSEEDIKLWQQAEAIDRKLVTNGSDPSTPEHWQELTRLTRKLTGTRVPDELLEEVESNMKLGEQIKFGAAKLEDIRL